MYSESCLLPIREKPASRACIHSLSAASSRPAPPRPPITLQAVMSEFQDIRLAFGESDEYSFVFSKGCELYGGGREGGSGKAPGREGGSRRAGSCAVLACR